MKNKNLHDWYNFYSMVDIFFVKSVQLNLVRAGTYSLWSPLITIISAVTSMYLFSKFKK